MRKTFKSQAIVIASKPYSEADKIITLFTKDYGKITTLAKGVKRLKSKKRASLENFSYINFSASQTKGMPILTETEVVNTFSSWKNDIKKVSVAYYLSEVIQKTTQEEEPHRELFILMLFTLKSLENSSNLREVRYSFSKKLLENLGFWPEGKKMLNPDYVLEDVIEKRLSTVRVGKKLVT